MNNERLISVIIDTYNYGIHVEDAIKSVLNQTLAREQYEIIVIDDGSTDDTRQRISRYLSDVIYHYKENGGQASAFNAGISLARGEFIAFLDADDYWYPEKLTKVLKAFSSNPCIDVVYNTMNVIDKSNRIKGITPAKANGSLYAGRPIEYSVHCMTPAGSPTSGIAWRRSALESLLPIPEAYRICADGYLMTCAPIVARKCIQLNDVLGCYRLHGNNLFSTLSLSDYVLCAKSDEVASRYRRLFLDDFLRLTSEFKTEQSLIANELKSLFLADGLLAIKKSSGMFQSLASFWLSRSDLYELPWRLRMFRTFTILLKLFVAPSLYVTFQHFYASSYLYAFTQIHIRKDRRVLSSTDFAPSRSQSLKQVLI